MIFKVSESLPFYWRLTNEVTPPGGIPDRMPFSLEYKDGLLVQSRTPELLDSLEHIYNLDYNIGYIQEGYEIAKGYFEDFREYLLQQVQASGPNLEIVEIGCGGATLLRELGTLGHKVMGVDPSPVSIRASQRYNLKLVPDFFTAETEIGTPDLVYHMDVLEHVENPISFLVAQRTKMKPGAKLVISVPDASESLELGDLSICMHQHLQYFTRESLVSTVEQADFVVDHITQANFGGSLYLTAHASNGRTQPNTRSRPQVLNFDRFIQSRDSFNKYLNQDMEDFGEVAFYVPLRAMPYLYTGRNSASERSVRFFDDTKHWYGCHFDGSSVEIENISDLIKNPPPVVYIMSLTFGDLIEERIMSSMAGSIVVRQLRHILKQGQH
jgi:2-polyprenyl-3-methyl-5-hydroxy-6-metoxy-1,4-benzoquinol methylase